MNMPDPAPTPNTDFQDIERDMTRFEECHVTQDDLGKSLAAIFVLSCRFGINNRVDMMFDFVVRNKHRLASGNNNALDMGAQQAAYHNQGFILHQLWPHLTDHIQTECLFGLVDADHATTFHEFFDPQLIDPNSQQGQRILGQAAIRQNEDVLSLLMPLFPPFDPQQLLETIGQWFKNDPFSDQAVQMLTEHQHRQRMREQLEQAADGGGIDTPKKKM